MTMFQIDSGHSSIEFSVRHLVVARVRGRFAKFSGAIDFDEGDITRSKVTAEILATSINTNEEKRDAHLRSADFLDAENYPVLRFASRRIEKHGKEIQLAGALTIGSVTHDVVLHVEDLGVTKDPWGNQRIAFAALGTIDRKDFGLRWNQVLETGGFLVGDKIELTFDIQAVKVQAVEPAQPTLG